MFVRGAASCRGGFLKIQIEFREMQTVTCSAFVIVSTMHDVCFIYLFFQFLYLFFFLKESRVLRTVPLLAACLPQEKCNVIVGRRFNEAK